MGRKPTDDTIAAVMRELGRRGGARKAERMSVEEKSEHGRKMALARAAKRKDAKLADTN